MITRVRMQLVATLMVGLGGGCGSSPGDSPDTAPGRVPSPSAALDGGSATTPPVGAPADEALLGFVARAAPGDQVVLRPTPAAAEVTVIMERAYHAASDKACRRFRLVGGQPPMRTACRDRRGRWYLLPPLEGATGATSAHDTSRSDLG